MGFGEGNTLASAEDQASLDKLHAEQAAELEKETEKKLAEGEAIVAHEEGAGMRDEDSGFGHHSDPLIHV